MSAPSELISGPSASNSGGGAGEAGQRAVFSPLAVLAMLVIGAGAFLAMLYFIGAGETGDDGLSTGGHALSNGVNGYSALARLLEEDGREVIISRNEAESQTASILVVTPASYNEDELNALLKERATYGPTIIILPKWQAMQLPGAVPGAKPGWVLIDPAYDPGETSDYRAMVPLTLSYNDLKDSQGQWLGLGQSSRLPDAEYSVSAASPYLMPLAVDKEGRTLAGFLDNSEGGADEYLYDFVPPVMLAAPAAEESAQQDSADAADGEDDDAESAGPPLLSPEAPVIIVSEADLMNNYGMGEKKRAIFALELINLAGDVGGYNADEAVTFDVTVNGLGRPENLLTLAFKPPFLAATLCLIFALLVVAWRGFARFGPPVSEGRALAFGKERLVRNSAALILRARRLKLLQQPYTTLVRARMSHALGLRRASDAQLDRALAQRGLGEGRFSAASAALENATGRAEIVEAAQNLQSLERKLSE